MILLVALDFLSFYSTALGRSVVQSFATLIQSALPFTASLKPVVFLLIFGFFAGVMAMIYLAGEQNKVKLLSLISFLIFLPSALSFSTVGWISENSGSTGTPLLPSFFLTIISGIIILSCLIILNFIMRIKLLRTELLSRGANAEELQQTLAGSFSYALKIAGASALLSVVALSVLVTAKPLGLSLVKLTPYAVLTIGIVTIAVMAILVYYYLSQNR